MFASIEHGEHLDNSGMVLGYVVILMFAPAVTIVGCHNGRCAARPGGEQAFRRLTAKNA